MRRSSNTTQLLVRMLQVGLSCMPLHKMPLSYARHCTQHAQQHAPIRSAVVNVMCRLHATAKQDEHDFYVCEEECMYDACSLDGGNICTSIRDLNTQSAAFIRTMHMLTCTAALRDDHSRSSCLPRCPLSPLSRHRMCCLGSVTTHTRSTRFRAGRTTM